MYQGIRVKAKEGHEIRRDYGDYRKYTNRLYTDRLYLHTHFVCELFVFTANSSIFRESLSKCNFESAADPGVISGVYHPKNLTKLPQ